MPILYIDGIAQHGLNAQDACQCEWCGEPLVARPKKPMRKLYDNEARYYTNNPHSDENAYHPTAVLLTRLCKVCIHILSVMGDDGVLEMQDRDGGVA